MENVVALVHLLIAVLLVVVILVQDPKGGSAGLFGGGGGANSLFGATGAPTFLSKLTRYLGVAFAITCIGLSLKSCEEKSVTDQISDFGAPATLETFEEGAAVPTEENLLEENSQDSGSSPGAE